MFEGLVTSEAVAVLWQREATLMQEGHEDKSPVSQCWSLMIMHLQRELQQGMMSDDASNEK